MRRVSRRDVLAMLPPIAGTVWAVYEDDETYYPPAPAGAVNDRKPQPDPVLDASLQTETRRVEAGSVVSLDLVWTNLTDSTVSGEVAIRWGGPPGPPEDDTLDGTVGTASVELEAGEVEKQTDTVIPPEPGTHFYTPVETDHISSDGVVLEVVLPPDND